MTTTKTATPGIDTTLILKRTFAAPKEKVFNAWTTPEMLKQWFAASDDYVSSLAEVDLRVGGKYRVAMKHLESGNTHTAIGTYREVKPSDRLVFTWAWEGDEAEGETLVTVNLRETEGGTEMTFKHKLFVSKESRDKHEQGWIGCFDKMQGSLKD